MRYRRPARLDGAIGMMIKGDKGDKGDRGPAGNDRNYVEDLSGIALGAGVSLAARLANSTILQTALAEGHLYMRAGTRLELGKRVAAGKGIVYEGVPSDRPVLAMPGTSFTNADPALRYDDQAVGLDFSNGSGAHLIGIAIEGDGTLGRFLRPLVARTATELEVAGVEVRNFSTAVGICLSSSTGVRVHDCFIHDFADSTGWAANTNITGIELDNDLVGGVACSDVLISGFRIEDLTVSGAFLAAHGYQSDGINIANAATRDVRVLGGWIKNVGEGIDSFGGDCTISDVQLVDSYIFGMKLVHGASRNTISNVVVRGAGLAGLSISGSDFAGDTQFNVVNGLVVSGLGFGELYAGSDIAGVRIENNGGTTGKPHFNQINGLSVDLSTLGKYGVLDTSTGASNAVNYPVIKTGAATVQPTLVQNGATTIRL